MSEEEHLWKMNWQLVQSINDLTEDIIKLKRSERDLRLEKKEMEEEMEDLKMKYYVALSDLNQERKKKERTKKWYQVFRKN
jgi:hypothetical protein